LVFDCKIKIVLVAIVFLLPQNSVFGQYFNLPNDYAFSLLTEKVLAAKDASVHSGLKPYIHFFSEKYTQTADSSGVFNTKSGNRVLQTFFYKHLISIESKTQNYRLRIDPLINFEIGKDFSDSVDRKLYNNTRGFIASGYIGTKVYFETILAENQSVFPTYLANVIKANAVVPGQGRWKPFRLTGYDYAFSSGFLSVQASKNLNIQVGHGKQKIGHGYRSLLLSDNAFNYPFARFTQQWAKGRIQYNNIYAVLMNLVPAAVKQNTGAERLFQKKAASFQYLSVNLTSAINLGLFQGLIWQTADQKNQQQLSLLYFNPLLFTNLVAFQLNNKNNIVIGADFKIKLHDSFNLYGQLMADDLSNSKGRGDSWGFQAGFNYFNALGIKNLFLQSEINYVAELSYSNPLGSLGDQSYSHYNQNLAYTPGSGKELIMLADYKYKRFFTNARAHFQVHKSAFIQKDNTVNLLNAKVGYLVNPSYNLNISIGIISRMQNFYTFNASKQQTNYIYIGLKSNLYNLYYDF
jgi:hypothetical protein